MADPVCLVPAGDWTGEGATWHAGEQALYWVDISRFLIHRFEPRTGNVRNWFFSEPPTALALTDRPDTMLVAVGGRVILWQPGNDARADFAHPEKNWPRVRLNDGRACPGGFFWAGSMFNNVREDGSSAPIEDKAAGQLYRIGPDGASTVMKKGIGISNTFCWSPDGTLFYTGDTMANTIAVWDYDARKGKIHNERPFFAGFDRGGPDGSAMDSEGHLWNARYGGACIARVAPDGRVVRVIEMPEPNVTTCTFGGPDLKTLFITTALGNGPNPPRLAGSLYALKVDVPGTAENLFRLGAH